MPDDGSPIPSWIYELRPIAEQGPANWFLSRAVEIVVVFAVSTATGVSDLIGGSLTAIAASIGAAGASLGVLGPIGEQVVMSLLWVAGGIGEVIGFLGPLALPVVAVLAVGMLALSIRVLRALADSVPVLSGIQTFLEGGP